MRYYIVLILSCLIISCGKSAVGGFKYNCKSMDHDWHYLNNDEPLGDTVTWQFEEFWVTGTLEIYNDGTYYFDSGFYSHHGTWYLYCDSLMFEDYFGWEHWYE